MFYLSILTIKKIIIANLLFVIFLTIIATFLIVWALPENVTEVDSSQTLLAARYFARDGFFKHYFLQLPSGYGKITQYFDDPELQQHAGGTVSGSLIGKKMYYTHFPNFYIIPTVLMMKLGIESLFLLRLLSIILSLLSLIFLYVFIKLVSNNKYIAFIAVLYFGISQVFLVSAKVLYFIPMENMLRFLILMLSIFAINRIKSAVVSSQITRRYILSIWVVYFLLALTSFSSTFFIFTYLVGLSAIYLYKLPFPHKIRTFLLLVILWASAPILGFALQIIQNVAYLGWYNMWFDIYGSLTASGNSSDIGFIRRVEGLIRPFVTMSGLYNFYILTAPFGMQKIKQYFFPSITSITYVLPFLTALAIAAVVKLKKITGYVLFPLEIPALLVIATLVQALLLPLNSFRDNTGPLTAPIVGIIMGSIVWMLFLAFAKFRSLGGAFSRAMIIFVSVIILSLFAVQIVLNSSSYFGPNHVPLSDSDIAFTKTMQKIVDGEKAVFMINTVDTQLSEEVLKKRFALIDPKEYLINYRNWEYYFDMPLLNFTRTRYLVEDLLFLKKRAEFPFNAIITSDNLNLIDELYGKLSLKQLSLTPIETFGNRYFFLMENKNINF
ncbi:MAG: hypothetical protein NTV77_03175 [Candidatus Azambacteria bacterium]|nr:hypothetical protein [Candidatus Azambacteria bacterium]